MCAVLGSSLQEGFGHTEPIGGPPRWSEAGACDVEGKSEGAGLAQPREEMASGRTCCCLQLLPGPVQRRQRQMLLRGAQRKDQRQWAGVADKEKIFRTQPKGFSNLLCLRSCPRFELRTGLNDLKIPFDLSSSVICLQLQKLISPPSTPDVNFHHF